MAENETTLSGDTTPTLKEKKFSWNDIAKKVVGNTPEAKNIEKVTQTKLKELQESLKNWEMSLSLTKSLLESLKEISSENKAFILAWILWKLNKRWISVLWIKNEQIDLWFWKENIIWKPNVATHDEVTSYQNIFNNYLSGWFFTVPDFHKALLYRTTWIESYINEKIEGQKLSTHEYALRLLEKYNISVVAYGENKDEINSKKWTAQYFDWFFQTQEQYLAFKADIKKIITDNQSDKEFLITYFDDIYYKEWQNIDDTSIEKFQKTTDTNERKLVKSLNTLSDTEKYALWVRDSNDAKELAKQWKNDPVWALFDAFQNGGGVLWIIFWIIGGIFWWKKWALGGFLGWMALGGGGTAFASEMMKGFWKNEKDQASSVPSSNQAEGIWNQDIYNKFETIIKWIDLDKQEQAKNLEVWRTLSLNETLMNTSLTELQEILKDEGKTKIFFLETCDFDAAFLVTNTVRIKKIYETLLKKREESIWAFMKGETLKAYLERWNNAVVATNTWNWEAETLTVMKWQENTGGIEELETLKREWFSDLYILSRWIELWYTFTKTPPNWINPNWNMWILGSTWYIIKIPVTIQALTYMKNAWWYFITWWLHQSLQSWNLEKMVWWTGKGINWIWNKASELLQLELKKEKTHLEKYLKWIDNKISWNNIEIEKITDRFNLLDKIDNALISKNNIEVRSLLNEYRTNYDPSFMWKWKWKNIDRHLDIEENKLVKIEAEIQKIETDTKSKILELETKAKNAKTPQEIQALRVEAENLAKTSNIEIERLNRDAAISLGKLDETSIKQLASQSKFVDNLLKANWWAEKFLTKFNGTWGKAFIWVWMISLIYNWRQWFWEMWENGFSEENKNDAIDLGVGFIPVIGGLHDLKIAWEWKDLNNRELTGSERGLRTAFGVVWLVPWFWVLAKWVFKWSVATVEWANIAIQTTNVVWKWMTYTLLWFSMATATKEIVFD